MLGVGFGVDRSHCFRNAWVNLVSGISVLGGSDMIWKAGRRTAQQAQSDALETARGGGLTGNAAATIVSLFALLFSGYSFYESVLRAPSLAVYAPPQIAYTDPNKPSDPFEVFILPLTIANDGARAGTVLSIDLVVENLQSGLTKTFYAAQVGTWGVPPDKAFAPVSLSGKASYSEAIQFFPRRSESIARILDFEAGKYQFTVTLNTAVPSGDSLFQLAPSVKPLVFEMQINTLDYRSFNGPGTMPMWASDYRPSASQ